MMNRFYIFKMFSTLLLLPISFVSVYGSTCETSKIRLEFRSQRWLSERELSRFDDMFGLSLAVKFRLVNDSDCLIYFLSDRNYVRPHGYEMFRKKGERQWEFTPPSRGRDGVPGSEFTATSYVFLGLLPNTSIEYEVPDWSRPDEDHAFTTFVKETLDGVPREIISDVYQPLTRKTGFPEK